MYTQLGERLKVLERSRESAVMNVVALDGAINEVKHFMDAFGPNGFNLKTVEVAEGNRVEVE
jgi:hypothetical protein